MPKNVDITEFPRFVFHSADVFTGVFMGVHGEIV